MQVRRPNARTAVVNLSSAKIYDCGMSLQAGDSRQRPARLLNTAEVNQKNF